MPLHNEYFRNAEEGQNKAAEWAGYIFPNPLIKKGRFGLTIHQLFPLGNFGQFYFIK